jgi:hypothetical protein
MPGQLFLSIICGVFDEATDASRAAAEKLLSELGISIGTGNSDEQCT